MIIENQNIKNLFIAITDNKVVIVTSGLQHFIKEMKKLDDCMKSKTYYSNHFEKNNIFFYQNPKNGRQYIFQKIMNTYKGKE